MQRVPHGSERLRSTVGRSASRAVRAAKGWTAAVTRARIRFMNVDVRHVDDVIIVDLDGRLVMGVGDELLRDVVNELLAENWKKILLNLRQVSIMDSSGIGEVVSSWKLAQRFGAQVKLLRLGAQVQRTLRLTQLLPLLEVFENEADAVASFQPA